jgi:23S rRNA pseudouridine1911/1915/1917 synthase
MVRTTPWKVIDVEAGDVPFARLDVFLSSKIEGLSRRGVQELISRGAVTVDGRPARKGEMPRPGSQVAILAEPRRRSWGPRPDGGVPLEVLYEDDHLLVVSKPSGLPTVPLAPDEPATLAGALAARYPECRGLGRRSGDGGLIHRLDRGTSGALLAARDASTFRSLVECQRRGEIGKRYLALVARGGAPLPELIEIPLSRAGRRGSRMKADPRGVAARTEILGQEARGEWVVVKARIHRGRRHQIRAHLAAAGSPIAGDPVYGDGRCPEGIERLCLHASELALVHPVTGVPLEVSAPAPAELGHLFV